MRSWLPLAAAIVLLAGIVYVSGQQLLRQGAHDPQFQMAEDAAAALGNGQALPGTGQVDMANSLAPYLNIPGYSPPSGETSAISRGMRA